MTPKTPPQNCEAPGHCEDHSGLITLQKVTVFLAGAAVGLLSYSVMWQAPNLRMEIAQQSAKQELKNATTDHRLENLEKDVKLVNDRLTMLEK